VVQVGVKRAGRAFGEEVLASRGRKALCQVAASDGGIESAVVVVQVLPGRGDVEGEKATEDQEGGDQDRCWLPGASRRRRKPRALFTRVVIASDRELAADG